MIGEDERMEEVLTRDFMSTTSGGIRLVTSRTGLNVFDTMGLEGVVGGTNISDVSTVSTQHVSMTGIPLAGGGGGGGGLGRIWGIGVMGGKGKKVSTDFGKTRLWFGRHDERTQGCSKYP